jgi:hypothetical protein
MKIFYRTFFLIIFFFQSLLAVEKDGVVMDIGFSPLLGWDNHTAIYYGMFNIGVGYRHKQHTFAIEDNLYIYNIPNVIKSGGIFDANFVYGYTIILSPEWGIKPSIAMGYTTRNKYNYDQLNSYKGLNLEISPEIYYQITSSKYSTLDLAIFLNGNYRIFEIIGNEVGFSAGFKIVYTYDFKSAFDDLHKTIEKIKEMEKKAKENEKVFTE